MYITGLGKVSSLSITYGAIKTKFPNCSGGLLIRNNGGGLLPAIKTLCCFISVGVSLTWNRFKGQKLSLCLHS